MSEDIREQLSALMDGELGRDERAFLLRRLEHDADLRSMWTRMHLVRDVIMCRDRGQINVKGFSKTVPIFEIVDHRKELGATQSFLECEMDGFTMFVDIDKIRNYDKDKVVDSLEEAAKRIREKLIV